MRIRISKQAISGFLVIAAGIGVAVTAYVATKDTKRYDDNLKEKEEEVKKDTKEDEEPEMTFKDKATIVGKSYWRTGACATATIAAMVLSHGMMAKELAATAAAATLLGSKYKEIDQYLKDNFPNQYETVHSFVDAKKADIKANEFFKNNKESKDNGLNLYYEPWTEQIFEAAPGIVEDKLEKFINKQMFNVGECTMYDVIEELQRLGVKNLKLNDWMLKFGWFEGDTSYSYSAGYLGNYIEYTPSMDDAQDDSGNKKVCYNIQWNIYPDYYPDLPFDEEEKIFKMFESRNKRRGA